MVWPWTTVSASTSPKGKRINGIRHTAQKKWPPKTSRQHFRSRLVVLLIMITTMIAWVGALLRLVLLSKDNRDPMSIHNPPVVAFHDAVDDRIAREIPGLEISIPMPPDGGQSDLQVVIPANLQSYFSSNISIDDSKAKGMVLLLHACTHSATKFFSPSLATCPNCVGLSEEMRIVRLVLEKGYIPVALSCVDRKSGCWNPTKDTKRIEYLLKWLREEPSSNEPLSPRKFLSTALSSSPSSQTFVMGASSGGAMAAQLVAHGVIDKGVVMVMGLGPKVVTQLQELHRQRQQSKNNGGKASSPKLYLAPMPRDKGTTQKAIQNYHTLCTNNCASAGHNPLPNSEAGDWIILDTTHCASLPVTVDFLMQRVPGMNVEAANQLIQALLEAKHMDKDSQELVVDPTRSNWRDLLLLQEEKKAVSSSSNASYYHGKFALQPGYSPLAKALHRAWAFHEYCSEVVVPALEFFEQ
ncbi:unnamed protein product [Cylindrotheca closterium]|uniref:Uncharacterized protein n=1 Tax=Cylindrotheca closterium TaxID=2856 RepID=A0AAD2JGH2_9STRA|nr:unnamed protein product [Cylindrotheca closterium]